MHTHTHPHFTEQHEARSCPAKCSPCSSILVWWSATTLKRLCFRLFNLKSTLFLWALTAFHSGKKHLRQRHLDRKTMWKQIFWVTITDAVRWALFKQDRLNRCSLNELLLKWGINPSTLLKCTVTDSGKLLSAGLFACLLHSRQPNLPCGKALIKRSGVSSPVTVDTIMFYKETNNV